MPDKEISRLRSEVRKLLREKDNLTKQAPDKPFTGVSSGNYWTQTGMPWVSDDGRKAVLTEWFWQPIRGQPRRVDTNELRQFSQTFWVNSCVTTFIDEITTMDWDIIAEDDYNHEWVKEDIKKVKKWLEYPNKNNESFTSIIRAYSKDILELDAGVMVKVFDLGSYDFNTLEAKSGAPILKPKGQRNMLELYARDGASFLKETDKFGFVQGYWQYSYQIPAHPMWFNKDEISYCSKNTRSMSCYGYAPTQAILDIVKSLHYSVMYNRKFFEENSIPDGVLSILDTNPTELNAFVDNWTREFKANPHKFSAVNKDVKWTPFQITQRELEFLETQTWYYKLVISSFGLTPTELGLTDDANRSTSATQAEVSRRKGIRPFLKLLEYYINKDIIEEFGIEGIKFQFIYDDPTEKAERLANWQMEVSMGVKTINEIRNEMGLEEVEWGDAPTNVSSYSTMGQSMQEEEQTPAEENAQEQTGKEEKREEVKKAVAKMPIPEEKLKQIANESGFDYEAILEGFKVETEHKDTVNNNEDTVIKILLDHLKEDKEYYTKLKTIEKEIELNKELSRAEKNEIIDLIYGKLKNDIYLILQRLGAGSGASATVANLLSQRGTAKSILKKKELSKEIGQYYNEADKPQLLTCPHCGRNALTNQTDFADMGADGAYYCINCKALVTDKELLNNPIKVMESTPTKSVMTQTLRKDITDLDLSTKEYCNFDYHKSWNESLKYVDSPEYQKLLMNYLKSPKDKSLTLTKKEIQQIVNILKEGMFKGHTISQLAKELDTVVKDIKRSQMIARTETIRIANEGNINFMASMGATKAKWIAGAEDGRTCNSCKKLDGKVFSLKEMKNKLPLHPRCRCSSVGVY